jgi:ketosteroid isomerase-like protein
MSTAFRHLASAVLAALALAGCAAASGTADEEALRRLLRESADAFNAGDLPGHLADYDQSVTFMTRNGPRPGIAPIEEAFRERYFKDGRPKQQLRFENESVRLLADDVALVTGRYILSGGGEPEQSGWFTTVWKRTVAGWKVVHDHSN